MSRRLGHTQLWIQSLDSAAGPVPPEVCLRCALEEEREEEAAWLCSGTAIGLHLLVVTGCCVERSDTRGAIDFSYLSPGLVAGLTQG